MTLPESTLDSPRQLLADRVHAVGCYGPYDARVDAGLERRVAGGRHRRLTGVEPWGMLQGRIVISRPLKPIRQVEERERDARHS